MGVCGYVFGLDEIGLSLKPGDDNSVLMFNFSLKLSHMSCVVFPVVSPWPIWGLV